MALEATISLWIGVLLTLMALSFVIKENFFFRIAEYTLIGAATAQYCVTAYARLANFAQSAAEGRYLLFIAFFFFGPTLFAVFRPKYAWLSRYGSALILGSGVGLATRGYTHSQIIKQIDALITLPYTGEGLLSSFNSWFMLIGTIFIFSYFTFTERLVAGREKILQNTGKIGQILMMIAMGASFGNGYMRWITLLLMRIKYVIGAFLGW